MIKKIAFMLLVFVIFAGIMPINTFATETTAITTEETELIETEDNKIVSPYLQQLPESIIGCTNLYNALTPVKGYYTATEYYTSNGEVLSVVIPVETGDRIAASSFGPVSENKGPINGIRVTYLSGDKIVTSLSAEAVYDEYIANGYITVPDGIDTVSVPWWGPSDSNWLTLGQKSKNFAMHDPMTIPAQAPTCTKAGYTAGEICKVCGVSLGAREEIQPAGHSYNGNICTSCGAVDIKAILNEKKVSVLGDSISTFNGYSNDAEVNTTIGGNGPRYDAGNKDTKPGSYCLLESVNDTWWMDFANRSGMELLVNNSWAGSQVFGGATSDGRVIPAAYLYRCINLHDNTLENNTDNLPINPDVIFIYLGINDYNFNRSNVGTMPVDYAVLVNSDETYVTPTTFGEAYGIMLHKIQKEYPDAQVFTMTLLPENLYAIDKDAWEQHNAYIRAASTYYDIPVVDLAEKCDITWDNYSGYMIDKIHPTTEGMKLIADCIEAELQAYYKGILPHTHNYENGICTGCGAEQPDPEVPEPPIINNPVGGGGGGMLLPEETSPVTEVKKNEDGSTTTTTTAAGGTVGKTTVDKEGRIIEVKVELSKDTIKEAEKEKTPIELPIIPLDPDNSEGETLIDIFFPIKKDIEVIIPTSGNSGCYVASLVNDDGTEDTLMYVYNDKDGIKIPVHGTSTISILNEHHEFKDATTHWATESICFVTGRKLFNGTGADTFSPDGSMTRGMLMTVLARLEGVDTTGGETWYTKGLEWAVENGISDGSNPTGEITREQLVTMLYRYAKATESIGNLATFADGEEVSVWAEDSMKWAVGVGLIGGMGDGTVCPQGNATRAQVSAIMERHIKTQY